MRRSLDFARDDKGFTDCRVAAPALLRCPVVALPTERLRCPPTAATRFVEAQDTMLHFPQAENSVCILTSPLPTTLALRGPRFIFCRKAALLSLPRWSLGMTGVFRVILSERQRVEESSHRMGAKVDEGA